MFELISIGRSQTIFWILVIFQGVIVPFALLLGRNVEPFAAVISTLTLVLVAFLLLQVIYNCAQSQYIQVIPHLNQKVKQFVIVSLLIALVYSISVIHFVGNDNGIYVFLCTWIALVLVVYFALLCPSLMPLFIGVIIAVDISLIMLGINKDSELLKSWDITLTVVSVLILFVALILSRGLNYIERYQWSSVNEIASFVQGLLYVENKATVGGIPNWSLKVFSPYLLVNSPVAKQFYVSAVVVFLFVSFMNKTNYGDLLLLWVVLFIYSSTISSYSTKGISKEWITVFLMPTFDGRRQLIDKYMLSSFTIVLFNLIVSLAITILVLKDLPNFTTVRWAALLVCPFSILTVLWTTEDMDNKLIQGAIYLALMTLYIAMIFICSRFFSDLVDILVVCGVLIPKIIYLSVKYRRRALTRSFA